MREKVNSGLTGHGVVVVHCPSPKLFKKVVRREFKRYGKNSDYVRNLRGHKWETLGYATCVYLGNPAEVGRFTEYCIKEVCIIESAEEHLWRPSLFSRIRGKLLTKKFHVEQ